MAYYEVRWRSCQSPPFTYALYLSLSPLSSPFVLGQRLICELIAPLLGDLGESIRPLQSLYTETESKKSIGERKDKSNGPRSGREGRRERWGRNFRPFTLLYFSSLYGRRVVSIVPFIRLQILSLFFFFVPVCSSLSFPFYSVAFLFFTPSFNILCSAYGLQTCTKVRTRTHTESERRKEREKGWISRRRKIKQKKIRKGGTCTH